MTSKLSHWIWQQEDTDDTGRRSGGVRHVRMDRGDIETINIHN